MRVLFATSVIPLPPFFGGNINVHHILQILSQELPIDLVVVAQLTDPRRIALADQLRDYGIDVASTVVVPQQDTIDNWQRFRSLVSFQAPGPAFFERTVGAALRNQIHAAINQAAPTLLHVWGMGLAGSLANIAAVPKVLTIGDCFSTLHASFARAMRFPYSTYHTLVAHTFEAYEERVLGAYGTTVFFTEADRAHVHTHARGKTTVIPNGVANRHHTTRTNDPEVPVLAFHGHYAHSPNWQAAQFIVNDVRPLLTGLADRTFVIRLAGMDSKDTVQRLTSGVPGVEYVGYVDDLDEFLAGAQVYCAPILSGAGVNNKVLDALSAGLAVVATPQAVQGLPVTHGKDCIVATPSDFPAALANVLRDPSLRRRLSQQARAIAEKMSWSAVAQRYLQLYEITRSSAAGRSTCAID